MAGGLSVASPVGSDGGAAIALRNALSCALLGLLTSALFTFVIYPKITGAYGAVLDPDGHGPLALGLLHYETFSLYPSADPVVTRGPLYPLMLAVALRVSNGWWPQSAQIVQDLLFAATCFLTCRLGHILWGSNAGLLAGILCALHPFLFWYTSRIWVESLTIFLFTAIAFESVQLKLRPSNFRAILLGCIVAAACLCKGTFLPFLVVVPAALWFFRPRRTPAVYIAAVFLLPLLLIAPWTLRNWKLTHHFIPVHDLMGFNLRTGDLFVGHLKDSPWSFLPQWRMSTEEAAAHERIFRQQGLSGWQLELAIDNSQMRTSLKTYATDPLFLPRKILINAAAFWAWSETRQKTIAVAMLNLPLLAIFCFAIFYFRRTGAPAAAAIPVLLICTFYLSHLPIIAMARYSAPLTPSMLAFSAGLLRNRQVSVIS